MTYTLTPEQYATLQSKLTAQPHVTVSPAGPNAGTIVTSDVTLSYSYDGTATLTIAVDATHSFLARHASESILDGHIRSLIAENVA